jgi:hypothetical protein
MRKPLLFKYSPRIVSAVEFADGWPFPTAEVPTTARCYIDAAGDEQEWLNANGDPEPANGRPVMLTHRYPVLVEFDDRSFAVCSSIGLHSYVTRSQALPAST